MSASTVSLPANLLQDVETYVEDYIHTRVGATFVYHNFQHTCAVVGAADELAQHYDLSERDVLVLRLAAWFHDTGYAEGWEGHEERSATLADAFLRGRDVAGPSLLGEVRTTIMATRMPQQPTSFLGELLADADLSHLGEESYWDRCGRVRQEFALTRAWIMSDQEWIDFELAFMLKHRYHTDAARRVYGERKDDHIRQLHKRKASLHPDSTPGNLEELQRPKPKIKKAGGKKASSKLGRGVETMYRATYSSHMNLSSMADSKANIMLSVNAIILSMSAANLFPKLDTNPHLTVPTIVLMGVCLTSLFFAIQATRPKVTEGKSSLESIKSRRSNLLFFGNFYKMPLEDYEYGMNEMLKDEDFLYGTMARDIYYLGVVLAKKYAFLRICYGVFLYGFILAVGAFIAAAVYYNAQTDVVPGSTPFGF